MGDLVKRFTSFDKMMGIGLIKLFYVVSLVLGGLQLVVMLFAALASFQISIWLGFGALFGVLLAAVFGLLSLRLLSEAAIVFFKLGEDVSALRAQSGTSD